MRAAGAIARNGRGGPCLIEVPTDIWQEEIGDFNYTPVVKARTATDPADVRKAAAAILAATVRAVTVPVTLADDPLTAVVMGAGKALDEDELFSTAAAAIARR